MACTEQQRYTVLLLVGHWSVWVSGNWRMTFKFDVADASVVNYLDYH
jgi:proteic killer suppression protein